jgi:hypothetical protein
MYIPIHVLLASTNIALIHLLIYHASHKLQITIDGSGGCQPEVLRQPPCYIAFMGLCPNCEPFSVVAACIRLPPSSLWSHTATPHLLATAEPYIFYA